MELSHWCYRFDLHTLRLGTRVRQFKNPFTGAPTEFPIDDGLTPADCTAIRRVFEHYGVKGPEPEGEGFALYLPKRDSVRFRSWLGCEFEHPPITGIAVEIVTERLHDEFLELVLEVARDGNLALMSSLGDRVGLVNDTTDPRIAMRWPDASHIPTISALQSWLEDQVGGRMVHLPDPNG